LEKQHGLLAKQRVETLLPEGHSVTLKTELDNSEDKFGRILGVFYTDDGVSVNNHLVSAHLAVEYFGKSKDDIIEEHLRNRERVLASV